MTRSALLAAAAALSLSACAATVDEGGDGSSAPASAAASDMTPETASAFVPMAASSDTFEINSSQLALQRATGADTRAYAQISTERLQGLGIGRTPGFQTLADFTERRLVPALRTCESFSLRLDDLSQRAAWTSELLRTRIEVALAGLRPQL